MNSSAHLASLLGLLSLAWSASAQAAPRCVQVKPGRSLSRFALGATRAELEKQGAKAGPMSNMLKKGSYSLYLSDKGKLNQIELEVPSSKLACIELHGQRLNHRAPSEAFAMALKDCGRFQPRVGGNVSECPSGAMVTQHVQGFSVRVVPPKTQTTAPPCDGYIVPSKLLVAPQVHEVLSAKKRSARMKIKANKNYCMGGRVLPSSLKPSELNKKYRFDSCRLEKKIGATTFDCPYDGFQLTFAGPQANWNSVKIYPAKPPHTP